MAKFIVKTTNTGIKFVFEDNGKTLVDSEVYTTEAACMNGVESVKRNAVGGIEDQTVEGFEVLAHPKFEVYADKAGDIRLRIKAKNGQIVASSPAFKEKAAAIAAVECVKKEAPEAPVEKV